MTETCPWEMEREERVTGPEKRERFIWMDWRCWDRLMLL